MVSYSLGSPSCLGDTVPRPPSPVRNTVYLACSASLANGTATRTKLFIWRPSGMYMIVSTSLCSRRIRHCIVVLSLRHCSGDCSWTDCAIRHSSRRAREVKTCCPPPLHLEKLRPNLQIISFLLQTSRRGVTFQFKSVFYSWKWCHHHQTFKRNGTNNGRIVLHP